MAQMPALIPKEVEIQRLKKIWLIVIAMGSTAASVEVDNFVDGSLDGEQQQSMIEKYLFLEVLTIQ
jgi:hypothetical protein